MDDTVLKFPCKVPVKVFGRNDDAFRSAALEIVRRHFDVDEVEGLSERTSRAERYLSLTITVRAESRAQVDALYRELTANDVILVVL